MKCLLTLKELKIFLFFKNSHSEKLYFDRHETKKSLQP